MAVRAVLFDVDGTLVDHDGAARRGLAAHLGALDLDQATWRRWVSVEHRHFDRYLTGELTFVEQRRARAREFLGTVLTGEQADAWFAAYLVHFEAAWQVYDDVRPALAGLAAAGRRLGAFSNVDGAYTRRKLAATGLLTFFPAVLGRDDVVHGKPAADPFLALAAALDVEPGECAHVGDRYEVDARPAAEAGLLGVWLCRPDADPLHRQPTATRDPRVLEIASLAELADGLGARAGLG